MIKNREGFLTSDLERECTQCRKVFKRTSKTVTLCNRCNSNRVINSDIRGKILNRARERSKLKGMECTIEKEDIVIPECCPILNIPLIVKIGKSGGDINSPALDRIDNSKGYIKGNIMIMSHLANMMKSCATNKHLINFSNWIQSNIKDEV